MPKKVVPPAKRAKPKKKSKPIAKPKTPAKKAPAKKAVKPKRVTKKKAPAPAPKRIEVKTKEDVRVRRIQAEAAVSMCKLPTVVPPVAPARPRVRLSGFECVNVFDLIRVVRAAMVENHHYKREQAELFATECNQLRSYKEARMYAEQYVDLS